MNDRLKKIGKELLSVTEGCRPDIHEPDEQGLSAKVLGTTFDNAFGNDVDHDLLQRGCQEIVIIFEKEEDNSYKTNTTVFNLADLIALARIGAKNEQL